MTSEKHAFHGLDDANSMFTKHDISQLKPPFKSVWNVENKIKTLFKVTSSLKRTSTTIVENPLSETRAIDDTHQMIEFACRFSICVKNYLKQSHRRILH